MNSEVQRADPRWRRRALATLALMLLLACVGLVMFRHWLVASAAHASMHELESMRHWTAVSLTGIGLCVLALAGYAAMLARQAREQRRWPPQTMRVMRDTPVRRDETARRIAHRLDMVACALTAMALITAIAGWLQFGTH